MCQADMPAHESPSCVGGKGDEPAGVLFWALALVARPAHGRQQLGVQLGPGWTCGFRAEPADYSDFLL